MDFPLVVSACDPSGAKTDQENQHHKAHDTSACRPALEASHRCKTKKASGRRRLTKMRKTRVQPRTTRTLDGGRDDEQTMVRALENLFHRNKMGRAAIWSRT